jgi:hypothetical protein
MRWGRLTDIEVVVGQLEKASARCYEQGGYIGMPVTALAVFSRWLRIDLQDLYCTAGLTWCLRFQPQASEPPAEHGSQTIAIQLVQ